MPVRRAIRESAFRLARRDLAEFLVEHEEDLLAIFREEMQHLDDELPEEAVFIDLDLVSLGDVILQAALRAFQRFLTEMPPSEVTAVASRKRARGATRIPVVEDG
jgi:hypothetical protein